MIEPSWHHGVRHLQLRASADHAFLASGAWRSTSCHEARGCLTSVIPQLVPKRCARIQRSIATAGRSAIFAVHRTTASVITAISAHLATASAVMANEASAVAVSTVPASDLALADGQVDGAVAL